MLCRRSAILIISTRRSRAIATSILRKFSACRSSREERSEEHTSELQSPYDLVCRLLLEKKKKNKHNIETKQKTTITKTIVKSIGLPEYLRNHSQTIRTHTTRIMPHRHMFLIASSTITVV